MFKTRGVPFIIKYVHMFCMLLYHCLYNFTFLVLQRTKLYIMFHALIAIFCILIFLCLFVLSVCLSACNKHQTFIFTCPEKILTFIIIENAPICNRKCCNNFQNEFKVIHKLKMLTNKLNLRIPERNRKQFKLEQICQKILISTPHLRSQSRFRSK